MPIMEAHGFELVDVEYVREGSDWFLRVYADKPGGITIDDCETISRALDPLLDKEDFIKDSYILEVSSPGLGRQLKKDRDFERSIGEEVEGKLFKAVGQRKEFKGILKSWSADEIVIEEDGTPVSFERRNVSLIRLAVDF